VFFFFPSEGVHVQGVVVVGFKRAIAEGANFQFVFLHTLERIMFCIEVIHSSSSAVLGN